MMVYAGDPGRSDKVGLSREQIRSALQRGGRVDLGELLRLKLPYLSDGLIFGSREFVEEVFRKFQDRFSERRTTGARRMFGLGWEYAEFAAARDLRKDAAQ